MLTFLIPPSYKTQNIGYVKQSNRQRYHTHHVIFHNGAHIGLLLTWMFHLRKEPLFEIPQSWGQSSFYIIPLWKEFLLEIRYYCVMHGHKRCRNEMKVTQAERSKAISGVTGHILHSFCAGDHGFKGIVGTFLINQLLFFCTGHSISWHANENNFPFFFFLQIHFHTTRIKLQHQHCKKRNNNNNWLNNLERV